MKAMVDSGDDDTDFFDFFARVLQGDTFALNILKISLYYGLITTIDLRKNDFTLKNQEAENILQ